MKKTILFILVGMIILPLVAGGQEVYRWVDEKGTVHFTDDLGQVPEKYREKIQKEKSPKESTHPPATPLPKGVAAGKESGQMPVPIQKDSLGRGEEWWRAKASEWNEKFKTAQKNYESAYNEWKSKEQELETLKYKPHSVKRKLKAEIKVLEEKVKDWEKQMEEAENMLKNILPKQAQDNGANPDWLNIEEKK